MSENVVLTGIVLTNMPIGDYDKRITILTKERGKITAFARGARRPHSALLAGSSPFCFGEFELAEGKTAYSLIKVSISNYFRELTADPLAAYLGFYFLEFAEYYCQENNNEMEMLKLVYQSLRALCSPRIPNRLIRPVFELKAMILNGEGIHLFSCMRCRRRENLKYLSFRKGGVFCSHCGAELQSRTVSPAALYTMQFVASTPVEKLYTFALKEEVLQEFTSIMKEYMNSYVHHTFKSLEIIDSLANI